MLSFAAVADFDVSYNSFLFMENSDYFPSKILPQIISQTSPGHQRVAAGLFSLL